jgi:phosphoribosylanthranilate isomerase
VKICGVNSPMALDAAVAAGADMLGFVFFPPSPRALSPPTPPRSGARHRRSGARRPVRGPDDAAIEAVLAALPLDVLQLHGAETPERCAAVRARFGLPVMKALGVASPADLDALADYAPAVDRFLLDAKPPAGANCRAATPPPSTGASSRAAPCPAPGCSRAA